MPVSEDLQMKYAGVDEWMWFYMKADLSNASQKSNRMVVPYQHFVFDTLKNNQVAKTFYNLNIL